MPASTTNNAWSNLWVPLLLLLLAGAGRVLGLITTDQLLAVLNFGVLLFLILVVIGLIVHLTRKKRGE